MLVCGGRGPRARRQQPGRKQLQCREVSEPMGRKGSELSILIEAYREVEGKGQL